MHSYIENPDLRWTSAQRWLAHLQAAACLSALHIIAAQAGFLTTLEIALWGSCRPDALPLGHPQASTAVPTVTWECVSLVLAGGQTSLPLTCGAAA